METSRGTDSELGTPVSPAFWGRLHGARACPVAVSTRETEPGRKAGGLGGWTVPPCPLSPRNGSSALRCLCYEQRIILIRIQFPSVDFCGGPFQNKTELPIFFSSPISYIAQ